MVSSIFKKILMQENEIFNWYEIQMRMHVRNGINMDSNLFIIYSRNLKEINNILNGKF